MQHETMTDLCQLAGDWRGDHPPAGAMLEQKVDGFRAVYLRGVEGLPRLFTRGGCTIEGTGHIRHRIALMEKAAGERLVLDGEFQVGGTLKATKAWCERDWKQGGEAGTLFAFDLLTQAEWAAGGSDRPLQERKARLVELWHAAEAMVQDEWDWREGSFGADAEIQPVRVLPHVHVFTRDEVIDLAQGVWSTGGEGCVLKDMAAGYERKRNSNWLKVGRPWRERLAA